jgi:hypothetical protein
MDECDKAYLGGFVFGLVLGLIVIPFIVERVLSLIFKGGA